MGASDTQRRYIFVAAVAALVLAAVVATYRGGESGLPQSDVGERHVPAPASDATTPRPAVDESEATRAAEAFMHAYLRYQSGVLRDSDRWVITRLATPAFRRQLLASPVRIPTGYKPPREWVARVAGIHVGLFEGRPALLVSVVVVGPNGSHVLVPTLIRQQSGWLVAGIGA